MPIDNSKYTLLLIHPALPEAKAILDILREVKFRLLQAGHWEEVPEIVSVHTPDLILIDIDHYPSQSEMLQALKSNKTTLHIPILLLTSISGENNNFPDYLNYDDLDFILKPYPQRELIIRIQHQLLSHRAEDTIRKQNLKLKQTLEARDKLYSVIAHDLRAPIGTIKMINSTIENQLHKIKDPRILKLFSMINATTEEAFNLLENLLRWTRNQNGKTQVYATSFNIKTIIRQVISLFHTIASNKNIVIQNHVTENISVYADEDMVKTVLRNLLSNAIKFTYPGGLIDITATSLPEHTLISMKDNGRGISKEEQKRLLKPNEYITTYGTCNEKGSGLGLSLSQEFVKLNQGKLWFSSQEGIGTTFFFTLPNAATSRQQVSDTFSKPPRHQ